MVASHVPPTGDLAHNPGTCLDWELNRHFGLQAGTQSTEPHQPGLVVFSFFLFLKKIYFIYLFIDRGEGREKERERNINVWLPLACPLLGTWLACNPGICPDWGSNR